MNLKGTEVGLVVPDYVTINSMAQMQKHRNKFKDQIIGIDPGAGIMSKTEKAIKDKDPKKIYGQNETIQTIVRKGLKEDKPRAHQVLKQFYWTPADMQELMLLNHKNSETPYQNAKKWLS